MSAPPPHSSWQIREAAGRAPAVVRVRGLQTTIRGPRDAWGRQDRPQPMLVSADVSLRRAFGSTSSQDALAPDTVHYGQLSKAILASVERLPPSHGPPALSDVLAHVWRDLTGRGPEDGDEGGGDAGGGDAPGPPAPRRFLLDADAVRCLTLTACLPKASLLGDGVSLAMTGFLNGDGGPQANAYALTLHALKVPTLIGINDHERKARQAVVVTVEVDKFDASTDTYHALEAKIVQEMAASSFGTLEALAARLAEVVSFHLEEARLDPGDGSGSHLTIMVEKPLAVPAADTPVVELRLNSNEVLASKLGKS